MKDIKRWLEQEARLLSKDTGIHLEKNELSQVAN